jgi:phage tail tape-measure protein
MSIPEKLRQAYHNDLTDVPLLIEAADEIERLNARVAQLEGQIERGVKTIEQYDEGYKQGLAFAAARFADELEKLKAALEPTSARRAGW